MRTRMVSSSLMVKVHCLQPSVGITKKFYKNSLWNCHLNMVHVQINTFLNILCTWKVEYTRKKNFFPNILIFLCDQVEEDSQLRGWVGFDWRKDTTFWERFLRQPSNCSLQMTRSTFLALFSQGQPSSRSNSAKLTFWIQ